MPTFCPPRRREVGGVPLIALLVVIAIIAILAAILFPTFFAVREKARQGTVLDHYRQINDALAKYKLDHHQYPPVLFGYASTTPTAMSAAMPGSGLTGAPGLYPSYINDASVFTDPNNTVIADSSQTNAVMVNTLNAAGALTQSSQTFYAADAFDANPTLGTGGALGAVVARYQRVWTSFPPQAPYTAADGARELVNPNPSADTFVTCTTYHAGPGVGQGKVMVLFQSGSTAVMDDSKFLSAAGGADGPGTTSPFWRVTP